MENMPTLDGRIGQYQGSATEVKNMEKEQMKLFCI